MVLTTKNGYLHLFPAIPQDWAERELSFESLRSYGGLLVSARKKGDEIWASLHASKPMTVCIKNVFGCKKLCVTGAAGSHVLAEQDGMFWVGLESGDTQIHAV